MKYWLLATILTVSAVAQDTPEKKQDGPEKKEDKPTQVQSDDEGIKQFVEQLKKRLELSDEEANKLKGVLTETQAELKKLKEKTETKVKDAIGEEKLKKIQRFIDGVFHGIGGGPGGDPLSRVRGMGKQLLEKIKKDLGLDEKQTGKVEELFKQAEEKTAEFFKDLRGKGPEAIREAFQAAQKEFENLTDKVKELLTDDQKAKFEEMMKEFHNRFGGHRREDRQEDK